MAQVEGGDERQFEQVQRVSVNAANDGDNTVIAAPGAGFKIKILAGILTVSAAANPLILKSAANELARYALAVNQALTLPMVDQGRVPWFELNENELFRVTNPVGVDTLGHLEYIVEAI